MTGYQPVDDKQDEKRDNKRFDPLADHDDDRCVQKSAINPGERRFNYQNADQLLSAVVRIKNLEFAPHWRFVLAGASCHHEGGGTVGGLAQFDVADIGQATNTLDLQLKLR